MFERGDDSASSRSMFPQTWIVRGSCQTELNYATRDTDLAKVHTPYTNGDTMFVIAVLEGLVLPESVTGT